MAQYNVDQAARSITVVFTAGEILKLRKVAEKPLDWLCDQIKTSAESLFEQEEATRLREIGFEKDPRKHAGLTDEEFETIRAARQAKRDAEIAAAEAAKLTPPG